MKLLYALFSLAIMSATTLVLASPAQAAVPQGGIPITVCGDNNTWYVNGDEAGADPKQGDRRPLATRDGLLFYPGNLIHHAVDFTIDNTLVAGTFDVFPGSPKPDLPDFFSIEVWDDTTPSGYGTLRWDSTANQWEVTKSGVTTVAANHPELLLSGLSLSTHARSFGVGYTNAPPGTAVTLVSSINFRMSVFKLSCAPGTSPSPVPVRTTVTKTVTVTPNPTTVAPTTDSPLAGLNTVPVTSTDPPFRLTPDPELVPASNATSLVFWGSLVALLAGLALLVVAIAGIVRSRRYRAAHSTDNSQTTMISPMYSGDEEYGVGDYDPSSGDYDPALGGHAGESYQAGHTETGDDTKPIPPVE